MIYKDDLIEKAETTIRNNKSLIEDDVAVAMLGIERITAIKKEVLELEIFIEVLKKFTE
ncbi:MULTISPECIES: hypothetical protein [Fusobacterium]|jgi:hypothetical protein|uniref:Uncharacterized protein n=1 Tax=Fusobacterium animalis 7_1 TaxID=457405 RepID=A0A140PSV1_9FUSO|nr:MULTISPECIES: hypothetical protein [Fusobacterium]AKC57505.1 hypothetical protein HMPREF1993_00012 [Fusobacterium phage Funu1]EEO42185.1 hypothetical protein FSDG_00744 [Fusobacterium animalis 7_1]EHG20171.1 hypothetical protein HMPREF9369_00239 [Fusobacterium polymorphum F0401]QJX50271.1 hypothetical protein HOO60_05090 [Fusobacterium nucleatum]